MIRSRPARKQNHKPIPVARDFFNSPLGGLRWFRSPNQPLAETPGSDKLASENSPGIVGIGIGKPDRDQAGQDSRGKRQAQAGPDKSRRDSTAAQQRGRAHHRRCDIPPGNSSRPKHRERVHNGPQSPCSRRAIDAKARRQKPKYAQKRQHLQKVQLSGYIRSALALKESVGDKGQSSAPRAKKEDLRHRAWRERKVSANPVSNENRGQNNARRAHRRIRVSQRLKRPCAQLMSSLPRQAW